MGFATFAWPDKEKDAISRQGLDEGWSNGLGLSDLTRIQIEGLSRGPAANKYQMPIARRCFDTLWRMQHQDLHENLGGVQSPNARSQQCAADQLCQQQMSCRG